MDTRHFSFADGVDRQVGRLFGCFQRPAFFPVYIFKNAFSQCDGRSARSIQFMDMMRFRHADIVGGEVIHDLRQVFVEGEKDVYPDAEIGGIEECLAFLFTFLFDFADAVQPACRPGDNGNAGSETFHIIVESRGRSRKLDGNVCALEIS